METVQRTPAVEHRLPIAHAMSFHDDKRCKTFTEIIVTEGGKPYVIGTRLYLHEGKIMRVDSLVTDTGDWLFNANAYLKYAEQEDWGDLSSTRSTAPARDDPRAPTPISTPSATSSPTFRGARRARGWRAAPTPTARAIPRRSCEVGIPPGVLYIVNRDYLVDEEKGVDQHLLPLRQLDRRMPDSHTFRFIDGKIRAVHTLSVNLGGPPSPQAE